MINSPYAILNFSLSIFQCGLFWEELFANEIFLSRKWNFAGREPGGTPIFKVEQFAWFTHQSYKFNTDLLSFPSWPHNRLHKPHLSNFDFVKARVDRNLWLVTSIWLVNVYPFCCGCCSGWQWRNLSTRSSLQIDCRRWLPCKESFDTTASPSSTDPCQWVSEWLVITFYLIYSVLGVSINFDTTIIIISQSFVSLLFATFLC